MAGYNFFRLVVAMEASFWHHKWDHNQIGFHENEVNPILIRHIDELKLTAGNKVFLPLCGKTLDIAWLISQGLHVTGAELSEVAVRDLFESLGLEPVITELGPLLHYQAKNIDIYVGDIFDLTGEQLGGVDAIYDRAALIALPVETRAKYTSHLREITSTVPQLLVCLEYDQSEMSGPPFSITENEVRSHYAESYSIKQLETQSVQGGLKGRIDAMETAWLLS